MAQAGRNTRSHVPAAPVKRAPVRPIPATRPRAHGKPQGPSASAVAQELSTCVTEADIVQVLYRGLQGRFGYNAINLQILEREGWFHSLPIDAGVLQDVRRRPLRESMFARQFANPKTTVLPAESERLMSGKGPGIMVKSPLAISSPAMPQAELIGSIIYHTNRNRRVLPDEVAFLDEAHPTPCTLLATASLTTLPPTHPPR